MSFYNGYFNYNGVNSKDLGLYFARLNTTQPSLLGGEFTYTKQSYKNKVQQDISSVDFRDPTTFEVEILSDTVISFDKLREINRLLFNHANYKKLYSSNQSYDGMYYNCVFTNVEKIYGGVTDGYGVCGFKCVIECDSQFAYDKDMIYTFEKDALNSVVVIDNTSDLKSYTFPKVSIRTNNQAGNLIIQSVTDNNRLYKINEVKANERIDITYSPTQIKSLTGFNYISNWDKRSLRLLQGVNAVSFGLYDTSGNRIKDGIAEVIITCQNVRVV